MQAADQQPRRRRLDLDPENLDGSPISTTTKLSGWREFAPGCRKRANPAPRHGRRYWSMGIPGPCGPSSEISPTAGPNSVPQAVPSSREPLPRGLGLVFIQNERGEGNHQPQILRPLPEVSTPAGVERIAAGAARRAQRLRDRTCSAGHRYRKPGSPRVPRRRATTKTACGTTSSADHSTAAILIGDSRPGNDGRGYVLLLRRVIAPPSC